jgi:hypothetical protein
MGRRPNPTQVAVGTFLSSGAAADHTGVLYTVAAILEWLSTNEQSITESNQLID